MWDLENESVVSRKTEANTHIKKAVEPLENSETLSDDISVRATEAMNYLNRAEYKMSDAAMQAREALKKGPGVFFSREDSELTSEEVEEICGDSLEQLSEASEDLHEGMSMYQSMLEDYPETSDEQRIEMTEAERNYVEALNGIGTSVIEVMSGVGGPFNEMPEYETVFLDEY